MVPPLVAVMGPTSSGKTLLGLQIADLCDGEVINADARQLYRDAPIGTGIPAGTWQALDGQTVYHVQGIPHHLMAVCGPDEHWSVADWLRQAKHRIERIHSRGKVPIVVGGTGLYIRALTEGFALEGSAPSSEIRERVRELSAGEQLSALERLAPEARGVIDMQNPYRVQRALERILAGQPLRPTSAAPSWRVLKLGICRSSEEMRARVESAVHKQLQEGWIHEVEELLARGVDEYAPILTVIGFRAITDWLRSPSRASQEALETIIIQDTWQYVRRQMTWLRQEPHLYRVTNEQEGFTLAQDWMRTHGILTS